MRRAVTEGIITVNPCDKVKGIANVKVQKDVLTADEVKRLFDTECEGAHGDESDALWH